MAAALRVLLAEDHPPMREMLRLLLCGKPRLSVVGEAADGKEAVERASSLQPDIVVMDLAMPRMDGLEATRRIHTQAGTIGIVVLTTHEDPRYAVAALDAGALGFVIKRTMARDLPAALEAVSHGERYLSPLIADRLGSSRPPLHGA